MGLVVSVANLDASNPETLENYRRSRVGGPFIGTGTIGVYAFRPKAENLTEIHRRLVNPH